MIIKPKEVLEKIDIKEVFKKYIPETLDPKKTLGLLTKVIFNDNNEKNSK